MNENQTYYFAFQLSHPLSDNWIEISVPTAGAARDEMLRQFGMKWSRQYKDADWRPQYFPGGRVGRIIEIL